MRRGVSRDGRVVDDGVDGVELAHEDIKKRGVLKDRETAENYSRTYTLSLPDARPSR